MLYRYLTYILSCTWYTCIYSVCFTVQKHVSLWGPMCKMLDFALSIVSVDQPSYLYLNSAYAAHYNTSLSHCLAT